MKTLVDTNVVVGLTQPAAPRYSPSLDALNPVRSGGSEMCVVPQVLYEFWTVCTRPAGENGLGMSSAEARSEQAKALSLFVLLPDGPAIFPEWQRLVADHDVKGKNAHDARLIAAMNVHGVQQILTFNGPDFARYSGITVLDPASAATPPTT